MKGCATVTNVMCSGIHCQSFLLSSQVCSSVTCCPQYGQNLCSFSNWLKQLSHRITLSTTCLIAFVVLTVNASGISFKKLDSFPFCVTKNSLSFALVIAT